VSRRFLSLTALAAAIACGFSPIALHAAGPIILVLGPPGSGKTVNAQKISKRYHVPTISVADLLKQSGGWGKAGSTKTLRAPVEQRFTKADVNKGFVLDGFPLTAKQAEYLENVSKQRGLGEPIVVHITVADSTATQRMLKRGRSDDNPATIERRLSEYHAQAELVLKRYPKVVTVDSSGTPNEVWQRVEQGLNPILPGPGR
jgi:adenylate kinase